MRVESTPPRSGIFINLLLENRVCEQEMICANIIMLIPVSTLIFRCWLKTDGSPLLVLFRCWLKTDGSPQTYFSSQYVNETTNFWKRVYICKFRSFVPPPPGFVISSYFNKHIQPAVDSSRSRSRHGVRCLCNTHVQLSWHSVTQREGIARCLSMETAVYLPFSKSHFLLKLFHAVPFSER